jgi:hypothetical protein
MKMRNSSRIFTSMVVIAFAASLLPVSEAAPTVRAGATCAKKSATQIVGTKKFTCLLVGKKLIWDKGVAIPKKAATPAPSPSPSSTQAPSEPAPQIAIDTKWYPWSFRFNSAGKLERKGGPVTNWSSDASRPGQSIDPIRVKAFEEIQKYSKGATSKPGVVNFSFGPNVDSGVEAAYRKYFNSSIKFYESRIPEGTVLNVVVTSEKDDEFTKSALEKFFGNQSQANDFFKRYETDIHQFISLGKGWSGGGSVSSYGPGKPLLYFGYVCSCFNSEDILMPNVSHEITHYFQFATTPNVRKQNFIGNYPDWVEGKVYIPSSLMEGSANTLGAAILVEHVGWYSDMMDWNLGRYKRNGKIQSISSADEAVTLMKTVKSWNIEPLGLGELHYALGQIIWEFYIATYGMESYMTLFANIEKYGDIEMALQKTENISESDFYQKAAPYVMRAFNAVTS